MIAPSNGGFTPELVDLVVQAVVVVLLVALLISVWSRWHAAGVAERRALTPGLVGGTVVVATLLVERTAILLVLPPSAGVVLAWSAQVVLVVWPVALLLGLLRSRLDRSGVGRLVVDLGDGPAEPGRLRSVVARTLHDPSAEVAYRLPGTDDYVDAAGDPVDVAPRADRAVAHLVRDGRPIAVLLHDPVLTGEPDLVEAVAAGAGLAVENERLHAEVRHQLREVRASRARLVEAADGARRRVERDLHDGAQQRLVAVGLALRLARARLGTGTPDELDALLAEAGDELAGALAELRELARGIYPPLLTDEGLGPALASLAERASLPVVLGAVPAERPPEAVEQACYFVVSEALTNAAKHASASRVAVDVVADGDGLRVDVVDDGGGGADADGSGLRGLADRVAAVGGRFAGVEPRPRRDPRDGDAAVRVIVADDAALFRGGLARLLADRGIEVTAEVGDAEALLAAVRADPPDAVIVDIRMPPTHTTEGLDAARTLAAEHPAVGVLVLSAHVESHYAVALVESDGGGAGYLLKERVADVEELTDALRRVVAGGVVVDPSVVAQLVGRRRVQNPLDTLSERERDVLAVMAEGRSNAGIGDRLHLSEKTVEAYARSAFTKLGLHAAPDDNRRVLAVLAYLRS